MENYRLGKLLGDGTFGSVIKATHVKTGQLVAIKKMKKRFFRWDECESLKEIVCLIDFHHPNIVKVYEVIKEKNELFVIFEFMMRNVYELLKSNKGPLQEITIRNIAFQVLQGLAFIHKRGYFHRDMKPENILENNGTVKIADFGLIKETSARQPYTDYVSTRWYRAPEVILRAPKYGPEIDIFAVGAILSELCMAYPLFPGTSEADQMIKICKILGRPKKSEWEEGYNLANNIGFAFPFEEGKKLSELMPTSSKKILNLIENMICFNPRSRLTSEQAIFHEFFDVGTKSLEKNDMLTSFQLRNESQVEIEIEKGEEINLEKEVLVKTADLISKSRYRPGIKLLKF